MIVAGLGSRMDVTVDAVLAALDATARGHGFGRDDIGLLATGEAKSQEAAFAEAALRLGVPLELVSDKRLAEVEGRIVTRSAASRAATGSPSISEAAALAAAGPASRLLGPRIATGPVTCALATAEASR